MARDLIVGGAVGYDWNILKYWVNSIRKTGFDGDIGLVLSNVTKATLDRLTEEKVCSFCYGKQTEDGGYEQHSNGAPHVERFFYLWHFLANLQETPRYVIVTDTRDVIFQKNPSIWLENNLDNKKLVCASEGLLYKDEPWGNQNLYQSFGPFFHKMLHEEMIYNVGTIAGTFNIIQSLMLMIFQLSINRPIPIVDQAVFNFIINQSPYQELIYQAKNNDCWAAQLGTSVRAVESGSGDLGVQYGSDPSRLLEYQMLYKDQQPVICDDGVVVNSHGKKFIIVHQYDRVAGLKEKIENRYGE
jgi:hypothetical protein